MIRSEHVQRYLDDLRPRRDDLLTEMEALAQRDGIPIVEWETGRLLATLVRALKPARVIEVGTAIGYSTLHMAREMTSSPPTQTIHTLERDPERIAAARAFWARDGVSDRIELHEGDALESLRALDGPFDLVFLDATKTEVEDYLGALDGKLSARALLVVDNLLMSGEAALPDDHDGRWARDSILAGRAAAKSLMASEEWLFSLLPVGDGVGLASRRAD